jgi:hypothetical protein
VFRTLKDFKEPYHTGVSDLLENVDFLEYFAFAILIFHVALIYRLNSDILSSKLVNTKSDLSKGSFTNKLDKLIVIKCCWWNLVVPLDICLDKLDYLVTLIENVFIQSDLVWRRSFLSRDGRPL